MEHQVKSLHRVLKLALCIWSSHALACNGIDAIKVGVSDRGYASYRTASGYGGISIDILEELSRRTGCTMRYIWLPSVRLHLELTAGHIDMGAHMLQDARRDAAARFLPYGYSQNYLVTSNRTGRRYASLAEFAAQPDTRLNRVRGFLLSKEIESQLKPMRITGRIETVNNFGTLFAKMGAGRAEAAIMSPWIYLWHVRQHGLERNVSLLPIEASPPPMIGIYLSSSTLSKENGAVIASALATMVGDGSIKSIYARRLPDSIVKQTFSAGMGPIASYLKASR